MSAEDQSLLVAYAERFNARDFDGLRDMLGQDVRLDLVAEYVRHTIHETGVDQDLQTNNGVQDKLRANVFIVGTRLAF